MSNEDDGDVDLFGRVAHTSDLRLYFDGDRVRGFSEFRAPKGRMFAVLVIGCDEVGAKGRGPAKASNINEFLKAAGWRPPVKKAKRARPNAESGR